MSVSIRQTIPGSSFFIHLLLSSFPLPYRVLSKTRFLQYPKLQTIHFKTDIKTEQENSLQAVKIILIDFIGRTPFISTVC